MTKENVLSDLRKLYIEGHLTKKEFETRVFLYLRDNYEKFHLFNGNRELWDEFLGWFYPRLVRAIERYKDQGSSFDAYITGLVYQAAKEYCRRESEHGMTEYICWRARAEEMSVYETGPEYLEWPDTICIPEGIRPLQVLILLLKSYCFASDKMIKKVAAVMHEESEKIQDMVEEVRKRCSVREAERAELRERVYCQYYRRLVYEKRMKAAEPGSEYYVRMKGRYERARKRYESMLRRLRKMRISASNKIVAEVIGIPKGTVDSNLFAIKHRIQKP